MAREKTGEGLTLLGEQRTNYGYDYAPEALETFRNKHTDYDYWVRSVSYTHLTLPTKLEV